MSDADSLSGLLDNHFEQAESPVVKCQICTGVWKEYLDMYIKKALENPHPRRKSDLFTWFITVSKVTELKAPSDSKVGECLRQHIPDIWRRVCGEDNSGSSEKSTGRTPAK